MFIDFAQSSLSGYFGLCLVQAIEALRDRGASELRTGSAVMDIPFVRCMEEVFHQQGLAALLATWHRDKAVPAVPEVAHFGLDEE